MDAVIPLELAMAKAVLPTPMSPQSDFMHLSCSRAIFASLLTSFRAVFSENSTTRSSMMPFLEERLTGSGRCLKSGSSGRIRATATASSATFPICVLSMPLVAAKPTFPSMATRMPMPQGAPCLASITAFLRIIEIVSA